ncbi:matrix metalloproteinase-18-like [Scyliorhinus torazame]|uniref:matrix metalloproteinase-18-like n=1 Tax=Scyliorhinus torazame TaxID=75743 RepID=UPI003B5ADFB6
MKTMRVYLTVVLELGFLVFASTALPLSTVTERGGPKNAQKAYQLKVLADPKTPRCGVSDMEQFSTFGNTIFEKKDLTYRLKNYTSDLPRDVVDIAMKEALQLWADVTPLTFTQTTSLADIEILFAPRDHGDGNPFDGPNGVLAHAFSPGPNIGGDAHFDEDERWTNTSSGINLMQVATHEFGHSLGLGHTNISGSVMLPFYTFVPQDSFGLSNDDIEGIQSLYGAAIGTTQSSTQTSTQAPTQTSTQAPTQTSTQAPTQTSTQAPTQTSTQAPTQTSMQAPTQTSTQAPTQTSTQAPTQTSTQAPTQTSTQAPTQTSTQAPTQTSMQAPTQTSTQAPTQTSTQAPTQTSTQAPTQTSTQAPTQTSMQAPTQTSTQAPTQTSTKEPSTCDPNLFADAIVRVWRRLFLFKNGLYKIFGSSAVIPVNSTWPSMMSNVDAAVRYPIHGRSKRGHRRRPGIIFFSGSQYWLFKRNVLQQGFPKPISDFKFPSSVTKIDAAMRIRRRRILFFVGNQFWTYSIRSKDIRGPFLISSTFRGISKVDAAFRYRGKYYLTSGSFIYIFQGTSFIKQWRTTSWMNCN